MQIAGPLGEIFGRDPAQFCVNAARQHIAEFRHLTERCSKHTGLTHWTTPPSAGHSYSARLVASGSDNATTVALIVVMWGVKNPGVLIDEANRMARGMGVGKSLDGNPSDWGQGKGLVEGLPVVTPLDIAIVGIIASVAIAALPLLMDLAKGAASFIAGAIAPKAPDATPAPAATPDTSGSIELPLIGAVPEEMLLIGAAAVLAFVLFHKKG